ncbi:MAG: hypothetical protein KME42_08470 [Tildeniella nuda ZEHNDER 1965/U140]|jgi:dsRNA-specific ribonuclease|nr:hypothetical protein [Tildeniella nuda ZEHNDER 1965/U140]
MSIDIEAVKRAMGLPKIEQCAIFENALLHPSYIYETNLPRQVQDLKEKEYRRLAHLGDAVIGAIVTDHLYSSYPDLNQGELTEVKQCLVDKTQLAELADELNLHQLCKLGKSQQGQTPETQVRLFAEMFEAVFGALYLEFDRDFARSRHWLVERIREIAADLLEDEEDDEYDEAAFSHQVTTRQYLDMIGLYDFPDMWAPGDDDY